MSDPLTPSQINNIEAHLRDRGLDPDNIHVIIDKENGLATFLLYNLSGQLVGYQRYNPMGDKKDHTNSLSAKYFTWVTKESEKTAKLAVWGTEFIDPDNPNLFVTEGIFDAVKIHNAGLPVVAVLGNNPKVLKSWFAILNKHTIAVIDNDAAGKSLANLTDEHFVTPAPYKDLGEMPQGAVNKFLASVGHQPKFTQAPQKDMSKILSQTIVNPNTDNKILISTALKYDEDHPARKLAQQIIDKYK